MPEVLDSVLLSIKKLNNVPADYTAFDADFIMYINAAFSDLNQLGIGPDEGISIEDEDDEWSDLPLVDDANLHRIKNYIGLFVRLRFDPPNTSFAIGMMEKQLEEMAWRISVHRETNEWVDPTTEIDLHTILQGGGA